MKQRSPSVYIGLIAAIILGFGILAGVWLSLRSATALGYEPNILRATKTGPNTASLTLSTFPNSFVCHPNATEPERDWVTYCNSTSLEVPPNSTITVTILNYDSSTPLHNNYFRQVLGTVGGTEKLNGMGISQINASDVAHTFTVQSPPDASYPIFVSVPIVGVSSNAPDEVEIEGNRYPNPNTITFQFKTGPSGMYIWKCYDPCGTGLEGSNEGFGGPMATTGYMAGTLAVASY